MPVFNRAHFADFAFDFAAVLLGVLLAFALSNWAENRSEQELVHSALRGIRAEVLENRQEVEESLPVNRRIYERLTDSTQAFTGVTLNTARLSRSAWESAQAAQVPVHMDYRVTSALSNVYETQEEYNQFVQLAMELIYTANVRGDDFFRHPRGFAIHIGTLGRIESELLDAYDEALAAIDDAAPGLAPDSTAASSVSR